MKSPYINEPALLGKKTLETPKIFVSWADLEEREGVCRG
jgi:hypothetical protein